MFEGDHLLVPRRQLLLVLLGLPHAGELGGQRRDGHLLLPQLLLEELHFAPHPGDAALLGGEVTLELGHQGGAGALLLAELVHLLAQGDQLPLPLVEQGAQVGYVLHGICALHPHLGHLL